MTPLSPIKIMRILLLTEIALVVMETILSTNTAETPVLNNQLLVGGLALVTLITHAAGLIGLWRKKVWGRIPYTASIVLAVACAYFNGPETQTPLASSVGSLEDMLLGAILIFMWFAMQDTFERPSNQAATVFS